MDIGRRWAASPRTQKAIVILGACVLAAVFLFPPWKVYHAEPGAAVTEQPMGWHSLFFHPQDRDAQFGYAIDSRRLASAVTGVVLLMAISLGLSQMLAPHLRRIPLVAWIVIAPVAGLCVWMLLMWKFG